MKSSSFHQRLLSENHLRNKRFAKWVFHPGMLFGAGEKWWGDGGSRGSTHEGIDVSFYRVAGGNISRLTADTLIPAVFKGEVVKISDDFLGKSIFMRHATFTKEDSHLYTIFGHTTPAAGLAKGSSFEEGEVIGTVAEAKAGPKVPAHLHVSVAWVRDEVTESELDWENIAGSRNVVLIDPLTILDLPYSIRTEG